jgi:hypothetical protein
MDESISLNRLAVVFDDDLTRAEAERLDERRDRCAVRNIARLSVDRDVHLKRP